MCTLHEDGTDGETGELLKRLVDLSRAKKDGLVSVAGPRGIEALGLLCREDYERVQCAREATCGGADDASDALIFAGALSGDELAAQVRRTVRLVRDGGVVAVQLQSVDDDYKLQHCLETAGYEVTSAVFDLSHEVLVAHNLRRRPALQQAA